jgi:hypothetical protein
MAEKRTVCLNLRVSDTEKAALQRAARAQGVTYTELIRRTVIGALPRDVVGDAPREATNAPVRRSIPVYSTKDLGPDPLQAPHTALHA